MNTKKIIFLASLFGIFLLIIISQNIHEIQTADIDKIYFSRELTTIITTSNQTLVLFKAEPIELKSGDNIEFEGSSDSYRGKSQIIIDKLWKIE